MRAWFEKQSTDIKLFIAVLGIYALVYLTITAVELAFGVAI